MPDTPISQTPADTAPQNSSARRGRTWLWALGVVLLLLAGLLTWWGLRVRSDHQVEDRVQSVLTSAGASSVQVSVSGGNATLTGTLPAGLSAEQLKAKVAAVQGVRSVITNVGPGQAATLAPPVAPTPPARTQPPLLTMVVGMQQVTVSGTVADDPTRTMIIKAASGKYGVQRFTENVLVDSSVRQVDLSQIPSLLKAVGQGTSVLIKLHEATMSLAGTVITEEQRSTSEKIAIAIVGDPSRVTNEITVGFPTPYSTSPAQLELNRLPRISFANGSALLTLQAKHIIGQAAAIILAHPDLEDVEVESYTNDLIPREQALTLSKKRAEVIVQELIRQGVPASRLEAEGLGSTHPMVPATHPDRHTLNQRIQFEFGT